MKAIVVTSDHKYRYVEVEEGTTAQSLVKDNIVAALVGDDRTDNFRDEIMRTSMVRFFW